jgi:hypothetical protein
MDFTQQGDTLIASGDVLSQDAARFGTFSGIKQLVLRNSPGGDVTAATSIGYALRDAKINTSVEGYCYSACSLIFLGGSTRTMTPRSSLGFHGCIRKDKGYAGHENARLIDYVLFMTDQKFDPGLADTAFHELYGDDLLLVGSGTVKIQRGGNISRVNYTGVGLGVITPYPEATARVKPLIVF